MKTALLVGQIILSIVIVASILLQAQGNGFGSAWGGGGETYHTRRGVEKVVFMVTIVAIILFAAVSMAVIAI